MAILDGIYGFPRKDAGEVGRAVAGRLLRFATNAGRVVSSLVSVDASGNLSTPGTMIAGDAAKIQVGTGLASFGHKDATYAAVRQSSTGETIQTSSGTHTIVGDAGGAVQAFVYVNKDATQVYRGADTGESVEPSAILQVGAHEGSAGGFLPPRVTTTVRNSIASPAAGLIIFNTTAGRLELYDGSAWVGLTTET